MTKHIPGDPFSKIKSYAPTKGYREGFEGIDWGGSKTEPEKKKRKKKNPKARP